jgi:hypothetical protein
MVNVHFLQLPRGPCVEPLYLSRIYSAVITEDREHVTAIHTAHASFYLRQRCRSCLCVFNVSYEILSYCYLGQYVRGMIRGLSQQAPNQASDSAGRLLSMGQEDDGKGEGCDYRAFESMPVSVTMG